MKITLILSVLLATAAVAQTPSMWREGPVAIEAQLGERPLPVTKIVYIDAGGTAYRDGVPIEALDREDLLNLVRELLEYEVTKSWPPERARRSHRRWPR